MEKAEIKKNGWVAWSEDEVKLLKSKKREQLQFGQSKRKTCLGNYTRIIAYGR